MRVLTLDFETFWVSNGYTLSKMGPIQYIRDPRFSAQLLGWRVNREPVQVCEHDDIPAVLASLRLDDPDTITVAHNGNGFDFLILSEIYGVVPANTLDTIDMMRWTGLSSIISESHASLTAHLGTGVKRQGTVISDGKHWPQDFSETEREAFKLYCMQDVEQCSENCFRLLGLITPDMLAFDTITAKMAMEPKLWADVAALRKYDAELGEQVEQARQNLMRIFHFSSVEEFLTNIRSAQKFCTMLRQLGVEPPMKLSEAKSATRKAQMEAVKMDTSDPESWQVYVPALSKQDREFLELQEHPDPRVALLVQTRLENNSSIQRSRVQTFIRMGAYNKPVPVMLKAFGAHTGRYAAGNTEGKSDSLNWQNLSKRNAAMLPLRRAIKVQPGHKLVSCDSSQIELRINAYHAQQMDLLDMLAHGADVYANFGEVISGIPAKEIHEGAKAGDKKLKGIRNVSKTIQLGCLGADTKVLTDSGWKPIVCVSETDKLWDGEQWVTHGGVIFSGAKKTMDVMGVKMTPNHRIYDGSSWHTAEECVVQPHYLQSALLYAVSRYKTFFIMKERTEGRENILSNACPAEILSLSMRKVLLGALMGAARSVKTRVFRSVLGRNRVRSTESLLSYAESGFRQRADIWSATFCANAPAEQNPIGYHYPILNLGNLLVAINVLKERGLELLEKSIQTMQMYAQTVLRGQDYLTGLTPACSGVTIQKVNIISTMEREGYSAGLKVQEISYRILSPLMALMTRQRNLIGLTMTCTMNGEICASQLVQRTHLINVVSRIIKSFIENSKLGLKSLRKSVRNCEPVFDIMNSGPTNRFTILTNGGPILVHNCGYGTSGSKAAHTMWIQGQKQAQEYDKHAEIVKSYVQMYREQNHAITTFWKICQIVIEDLANGGTGSFGGPTGALYKYGQFALPGCDILTPAIKLPSGYTLWYPNLKGVENENGRVEYSYSMRRGKSDIPHRVYGSAMTENCTQSLAFQLLQWQACRMAEEDISLVCNIHDSFSTVVPENEAEATAEKMVNIMRRLPSWLHGCPIDAEAEITDDFTGA